MEYIYKKSTSVLSKLIQLGYKIIGAKANISNKVKKGENLNEPFFVPFWMNFLFNTNESTINGKRVVAISLKNNQNTESVVLYLHGGAYILNIVIFHWTLISQLIFRSKTSFIVPDYPLAPHSKCEETIAFVTSVYKDLLKNYPTQKITIMGDSAGGGLSLALALHLKNQPETNQPHQLILLSPWVDLTHTHPEISDYAKQDEMLDLKGLSMAAESYRGEFSLDDFRVSPMNGNLSGLPKTVIFIGTHDLLFPDAKKLKHLLVEQNVKTHYYEYPKMFHVWMAAPFMKEANNAIKQIAHEILSE